MFSDYVKALNRVFAANSRFTAIHYLLAVPCPDVHSHDLDATVLPPWTTFRKQWSTDPSSIGEETTGLGEMYATLLIFRGLIRLTGVP